MVLSGCDRGLTARSPSGAAYTARSPTYLRRSFPNDLCCACRQCCNFADARRLFWWFSNCCACEVQRFNKRRGQQSCIQRTGVVGQAESTTSEIAGTRSTVLSTVEVTARTLCKGVVRRVVAKRTRSSKSRTRAQRTRRLVGRWRWRCKQREVGSLFTVEPLHIVVVLCEIGPGKLFRR